MEMFISVLKIVWFAGIGALMFGIAVIEVCKTQELRFKNIEIKTLNITQVQQDTPTVEVGK